MAEQRKRSYHSPVRAEAARQTRTLLRDTARRLFIDQGYVPTTMKQIALEAGVAERTLYLAFPSKAALLQELIGVAVAGGEDGPRADATDYGATAGDLGALGAIDRFCHDTTALYERAGELLQLGEHAAESDPELRPLADAGAAATLAVIGTLVAGIAETGALRADLTQKQAVDSAWASSHFSSHQLLRKRRRWSRARYQRWLLDTLTHALIDESHR